jgi:hypothetical protein
MAFTEVDALVTKVVTFSEETVTELITISPVAIMELVEIMLVFRVFRFAAAYCSGNA